MAYSTSNPPQKLLSNLDGTWNMWLYQSTDAATVVRVANYFTNGGSLGMKAGDVVWVVDTDGSGVPVTLHQVNATGDGSVDLTDATTVTQTDSD